MSTVLLAVPASMKSLCMLAEVACLPLGLTPHGVDELNIFQLDCFCGRCSWCCDPHNDSTARLMALSSCTQTSRVFLAGQSHTGTAVSAMAATTRCHRCKQPEHTAICCTAPSDARDSRQVRVFQQLAAVLHSQSQLHAVRLWRLIGPQTFSYWYKIPIKLFTGLMRTSLRWPGLDNPKYRPTQTTTPHIQHNKIMNVQNNYSSITHRQQR